MKRNFGENEKDLYNIVSYMGIFNNIIENYTTIMDDFECDGYIDEIDGIRSDLDLSIDAMNEVIHKINAKISDLKEKIENEQ